MPRILIIEDEEQVRSVTRRTLEGEGYDVLEAEDGFSGIKAFTENDVDLIITDIIMPGMEGIETIVELRKRNPEIKIIAISGAGKMGPGEYLRLAKVFGANHTFAKPFDRVEFVATVKGLLA
jgi:CheY-like chemotaxis protein